MKNWKDGRKLISVTCAYCNKQFNKTSSEFNRSEKKGRKHFCSINCSQNNKKANIKYCKKCGKIIKGDCRKIFCSKSCSASFNNKNKKGKFKKIFSEKGKKNMREALYKRLKICDTYSEYIKNPKSCKECGKYLIFKKRINKFCSMDCKNMYYKKIKTSYQKYYKDCQFDFRISDYPNEFEINLIEKYDWYKAKNYGDNLNGVSRDHMISINYGFKNNIDPKIIKHPANCSLMLHNDNVKKNYRCSLTLDELLLKIYKWNKKYNINN